MSEPNYPTVCGVLFALLADKPNEELTKFAELLERTATGDPAGTVSDAEIYVAGRLRLRVAGRTAFDRKHAAREVA